MSALSDVDNLRLHDITDRDVRDSPRWIALMGQDEVKAFLVSMAEKHLPGRHDQSSHGRGRRVAAPDGASGAVAVVDKPQNPRRTPKPKPPRSEARPARSRAEHRPAYEGPSWSPSGFSREEFEEYKRLYAATKGTPGDDYAQLRQRLVEIESKLPEAARLRAHQEVTVEGGVERFRERLGGNMSPEQLRQRMAEEVRAAFGGKKVAVRVTPQAVGKILADGRIKTQFEGGKTVGGTKDQATKARYESAWFGIPEKGYDARKRPVYGYVAVNGVEAVDDDDRLNQYGKVQVVLNDEVRKRTTAMFGDSLGDSGTSRPSPIDDPDFWSYDVNPYYNDSNRIGRDTRDRDWWGSSYAEAQIHGGITTDDIEEFIFPEPPEGALRRQLDASGMKWRVLTS